ncbi:MAG TPA: cytochrome c [Gaiellaceae bacterium]|jgi:mono/diheme cytochrome c family protein|nr:cytochrome c [Gaiellaceae bacterium]
MLRNKIGRRIGLGIAGLALATALIAPSAFGHTSVTKPKLIGNPKAGKGSFSSTCGACHVLKAAGAVGNIGPNLDKVGPALTEATIIKAITNGGATVMTKAAAAKYTTTMVAYKGSLTPTVINNIAAFVYTSTHK